MDSESSSPRQDGMLRLLHFDDDDAIRLAVSGFLRRLDIEVDEAATLAEARELVRSRSYDVLISDLDPGCGDTSEGLDFVRWVREWSPELPVLLLTGHDSHDIRSEAERLGVRNMLVKPHPLKELENALREALSSAGGDGGPARG